jgi:hypothetical protein
VKLSSEADVSSSNSSDVTVEVDGDTANVEREVIDMEESVVEEIEKKEKKTDAGKLSLEADVSASNK